MPLGSYFRYYIILRKNERSDNQTKAQMFRIDYIANSRFISGCRMTIINILCEENEENSYSRTHQNPSIRINLRNRERSTTVWLSCTSYDSHDFILPFFLTMYDKLLYLVFGQYDCRQWEPCFDCDAFMRIDFCGAKFARGMNVGCCCEIQQGL